MTRNVFGLIMALLKACRPTNIVRFVIPLVVDAIQGMLVRRPWPNVIMERLEIMSPLRADANTAPAVSREFFIPRIFTPLNSFNPCTILRRRARLSIFANDPAVAMLAKFQRQFAGNVLLEAPARAFALAKQVGLASCDYLTAGAFTGKPMRTNLTHNRQASENQASKIDGIIATHLQIIPNTAQVVQ